MIRFFYFLSISLLLLGKYYRPLEAYQFQKRVNFKIEKYSELTNKTLNGLFFGKKHFKKREKEKIKKLNLAHLFTPSGLHLSSLLIINKVIPMRFLILPLFILLIFLFNHDYLFSFQRNLFIAIIKYITHLSTIKSFIIISLFEFLIIDFNRFLSLSYSFIFLGSILLFRKSSPIVIVQRIWLAQIIISLIQFGEFNLISLLANSILSFMIMIMFLPLIIIHLLNFNLAVEFLVNGTWRIISIFYDHLFERIFTIDFSEAILLIGVYLSAKYLRQMNLFFHLKSRVSGLK